MPELPEVETIRVYLSPTLVGRRISAVTVLNPRSFIGDPEAVVGSEIIELTRHGKVMHWKLSASKSSSLEQGSFDSIAQPEPLPSRSIGTPSSRKDDQASDPLFLNIHLKMSGRLSWEKDLHSRVVIKLDNGRTIYFNDARKFGWMKVTSAPERSKGPDVLDPAFTHGYFAQAMSRTSRDIKSVLLDQTILAGVGNIYANDALWEAQISPFTPANKLTHEQCSTLYAVILHVIADGVRLGGSSKTWVYRLPDGTSGSYQKHFRVYDRAHEPCKRCGTILLRAVQKGRSSFYCPICQKKKITSHSTSSINNSKVHTSRPLK